MTNHNPYNIIFQNNNELFKTMIENSRDGIAIAQNGRFKYVNASFCEMVNYTASELYDIFGPDLLAPHDKERMTERHYERMQGKFETAFDFTTLVRKDGTFLDIEMSISPIFVEGEIASFISIRDITERNRMMDRLERSEKKYRNLVENAHDGIIITQNGKFKYVNKAFCSSVEYTEDELLESDFIKIVSTEDKDRLTEFHRLRMAGNKTQLVYDAKGVSKSGKTIFFEINTSYIEYNGAPATFIILRNHTEKKQLEDTILKSERKYRELADFLPQTIYELDTYGNLSYINKAGRIAFGLDDNELGFQATNGVIPEDRERMKNNFLKFMIEKNMNTADEYTALHKNGTTFPVIIYGAPMFENGNIVGSRGLIIDISERKRMENELRKSEERYRKVIQSLQEGLFVIQDERLIFVNDAIVNLLGYTVNEITGRNFIDLIQPDKRDIIYNQHLLRKNGLIGSWSYEISLVHKNGKTLVPVILSTNVIEFEGKWTIVGTAKDISERIKVEEELKKAHKNLEEINSRLEITVKERTEELTEANTKLLKLQKENIQSQFDMLKQQVNPHFLFNSLNVLTSLIRIEPELAEKFTEHLSKVYRYVLENKDNELINLNTELDFLEAYLFLINIRFKGKINIKTDIPDSKKQYLIIPLAMQLLIENAIKHNSMSKKSPLEISIFIDNEDYLNIINNLQERESYVASTGVGLQNITNRYMLLTNKKTSFSKLNDKFIAKIPLIKYDKID